MARFAVLCAIEIDVSDSGGRTNYELKTRETIGGPIDPYFEQLLAALVPMLVFAHHPPDIHVHLVIDLRREIAIVHRVPTVAQAPVLYVCVCVYV